MREGHRNQDPANTPSEAILIKVHPKFILTCFDGPKYIDIDNTFVL